LFHQGVNLFLATVVVARSFANVYTFCIPPGHVQHLFTDQLIMQYHICLAQYVQGPQRQQIGPTRAGPHQEYLALQRWGFLLPASLARRLESRNG
jgi:hypothetical protein